MLGSGNFGGSCHFVLKEVPPYCEKYFSSFETSMCHEDVIFEVPTCHFVLKEVPACSGKKGVDAVYPAYSVSLPLKNVILHCSVTVTFKIPLIHV